LEWSLELLYWMQWLKTWMLEVLVVGGIYSPNHQKWSLAMAAVVWRTEQFGAPPDTVRCASHATQSLGFDRWSSDMWGHRTVWCAFWRCSDFYARRRALFTFTVAFCRRLLARIAIAPLAHRTVRWIIAEWLPEFPKLASSKSISLVHRTLSGGATDTV
jgi:hypothetical protein